MSPLEGFLVIAALLTVSLAGGAAQVRRARATDSRRDQIIQQSIQQPGIQVWDDDANRWLILPPGVQPGPSQHTDREVAALDDLVLAWQADAFDPATDPQWAAGRARLLAALNNDDQQGDS